MLMRLKVHKILQNYNLLHGVKLVISFDDSCRKVGQQMRTFHNHNNTEIIEAVHTYNEKKPRSLVFSLSTI